MHDWSWPLALALAPYDKGPISVGVWEYLASLEGGGGAWLLTSWTRQHHGATRGLHSPGDPRGELGSSWLGLGRLW